MLCAVYALMFNLNFVQPDSVVQVKLKKLSSCPRYKVFQLLRAVMPKGNHTVTWRRASGATGITVACLRVSTMSSKQNYKNLKLAGKENNKVHSIHTLCAPLTLDHSTNSPRTWAQWKYVRGATGSSSRLLVSTDWKAITWTCPFFKHWG